MQSDGKWKTSNGTKLLISELQDEHLINCIKYMRSVILKQYMTAKNRTGSHMRHNMGRWEDMIVEAAKRHLQWDYSIEPPNPADFTQVKYKKRSTIKPARGGKPRASRSVNI